MSIEVTDEMIRAFEHASNRSVGPASLAGLKAVLAIVEHNDRTAKLEDALHLASQSRDLWKRRAIESGWEGLG